MAQHSYEKLKTSGRRHEADHHHHHVIPEPTGIGGPTVRICHRHEHDTATKSVVPNKDGRDGWDHDFHKANLLSKKTNKNDSIFAPEPKKVPKRAKLYTQQRTLKPNYSRQTSRAAGISR